MPALFARDLDHVLEHTRELWEEVRGERIFVTGGTGFFGCWLLESFAHANARLGLNARAAVLTRDRKAFASKAPHLEASSTIDFVEGDVRRFQMPSGAFSHAIHAATDADAKLQRDQPLAMLDSVLEGTRHTLDAARESGVRKFLLTSSGTIYGRQPLELPRIPETYTGGPDLSDWRVGYSEGKRVAELLCLLYRKTFGLQTKIARCFAFVGPHLPLDRAFAAGNFLRDALAGRPIEIKSDGTAVRSYLYAADLAVWLWTILFRGEPGQPYNVGSEEEVSVKELAEAVSAAVEPHAAVQVAGTPVAGRAPERYVPDVSVATNMLGLQARIGLNDALNRTVEWLRMGE